MTPRRIKSKHAAKRPRNVVKPFLVVRNFPIWKCPPALSRKSLPAISSRNGNFKKMCLLSQRKCMDFSKRELSRSLMKLVNAPQTYRECRSTFSPCQACLHRIYWQYACCRIITAKCFSCSDKTHEEGSLCQFARRVLLCWWSMSWCLYILLSCHSCA